MSAPRSGSIATKAMSQTLDFAAAVTLPAASNGISSTGTPRRPASSRARSTETPCGCPPVSREASTGLPRLIAAVVIVVAARARRSVAAPPAVVAVLPALLVVPLLILAILLPGLLAIWLSLRLVVVLALRLGLLVRALRERQGAERRCDDAGN